MCVCSTHTSALVPSSTIHLSFPVCTANVKRCSRSLIITLHDCDAGGSARITTQPASTLLGSTSHSAIWCGPRRDAVSTECTKPVSVRKSSRLFVKHQHPSSPFDANNHLGQLWCAYTGRPLITPSFLYFPSSDENFSAFEEKRTTMGYSGSTDRSSVSLSFAFSFSLSRACSLATSTAFSSLRPSNAGSFGSASTWLHTNPLRCPSACTTGSASSPRRSTTLPWRHSSSSASRTRTRMPTVK